MVSGVLYSDLKNFLKIIKQKILYCVRQTDGQRCQLVDSIPQSVRGSRVKRILRNENRMRGEMWMGSSAVLHQSASWDPG